MPVEAGVPFLYHVIVPEDPPFTGLAVNRTLVPAQITLDGEALIATDTGSTGLTDIVITLDVAGFPEVQVCEDVNTA